MSVIDHSYQFLSDLVRVASRDNGDARLNVLHRGSRLVTIDDPALRKGHSESTLDFLDRRWRTGKCPGIWLSFALLIDVDLEVEPASSTVLRADCGFHALVNHRRVPELAVSLRAEADFLNVGNLWLEHPHHHLQWDLTSIGAEHPSAYTRVRVPRLLPTEFAEFCLRHFAPDLWARRFEHEAQQLRQMASAVNQQPTAVKQQAVANQHRETVRGISENIKAACVGPHPINWQSLDCSTLGL